VPTLLVVGADTDVVPIAVVDALRFELGDLLRVVTVPGGHVVLWDAFEQTADAIESFLEDAGA
jgi:pimeloyl-ACP methyl ester carboxylesterase